MNSLVSAIKNDSNVAYTANGAKTLKTSQSDVLDLFAQGAALRTTSDSGVISLFSKAFAEDRLLALKTLFYIRDVRGGQGERKTFRTIIKWLAQNHKDYVLKNMENIIEFGRWDDLLSLIGTDLEKETISFILTQLKKDIKTPEKETISLLAKWLPSSNASSDNTKKLARKIYTALGITERQYRKTLVKLRERIHVLETALCNKEYSAINYEHVPSKASSMYRKAFLRNDSDRYKNFLSKVEKGEAKIHAGTLYPYDIVRAIKNAGQDEARTLEAQWNALPNYMEGNDHKGIVVADVSGSMSGLPMEVSVSLAIYFAQRNLGPFKNTFLTFSSRPTLEVLKGNSLKEIVMNLERASWEMSTNLQAVFDLILTTAVKNKIPQSEMPDALYIISDMQFNVAVKGNDKSNFQVIEQKYKAAGYARPRLVFWNVNATSKGSPVQMDETGTALVSGASPSILKTLLSAKTVTPYDTMLETLGQERYSIVKI